MTGRRADALVALLPVPVLAPLAAVFLSWKRGDLARPMPRRLVGFGECAALALGASVFAWGAAHHWPSVGLARPAIAFEARKPVVPVTPEPAVESASAVNYQVYFIGGAAVLAADSRGVVSRIADTLHYYPLDGVLLSIAAPTDGPYDVGFAEKRLEAVRRELERHGVNRDRVRSQIRTRAGVSSTVEVYILEGTP